MQASDFQNCEKWQKQPAAWTDRHRAMWMKSSLPRQRINDTPKKQFSSVPVSGVMPFFRLMGARVRGLGNSPTMEESHPLQLTAMSYIQQFPSPSRPYAPRESGGVIDEIPDESIMTPPHTSIYHGMLTMSPSLWQTWLSPGYHLAITAPFISLSWAIHVLCWQWNSHAMPGRKKLHYRCKENKKN